MNLNCEHCRDRLLDHVYGLLEGTDLQEIVEHLNACSQCQAELEKAQAEQKLLARAAHAVTEVPEFALPLNEPALPLASPATLPITSAPARRPIWRRPLAGWTTAAAVLIAVTFSFSYYRHTTRTLHDDVTAKIKEHKNIAERFTALPVRYEALHQTVVRELRTEAGPHLHVIGPTTLQRGAKGHLHITTRHVEGGVAPHSNIRIKVVEAHTGKLRVLHLQSDDDGHLLAELDASWAEPNSKLNVFVEAVTNFGRATIEQKVQIEAPSYVTRIDTNKAAYQIRDVLFFRVLLLERYSLQPPGQPIALQVELLDPKGKAVRSLEMNTGDGGVLAREFAIDDQFAEGVYTLNVRPIHAKTPVQSVSQRLEIVRKLRVPDFQFEQDGYLPGEIVRGLYRGAQPLPNQAMINDVRVPVTIQPQAPFGAFGMMAGGGNSTKENKVDEGKGVQRFQMTMPPKLPQNMNQVPLAFQVGDGKMKRELRASVPLAPTDFSIDFFPEGGDLIAGVQNRVFYRVRSKSGEPITGEGSVIILTSKNEVVDSSYQLGLGYFDFTPHPKETYTARITTPVKVENIANPFARHVIRSEGVVVHVPEAVGSQADPIRLTIRQQGPARKLLLLVQCRGQIVDQRWVEVKRGSMDVTLQPTPEATGMIRVTAYELFPTSPRDDRASAMIGVAHAQASELLANTLQPVAERLVYRGATQRLDLGFALNTQQIHAGRSVSGKVSARDEKGQPAAAWLLASVIDERFQARPRSLSAHFFLLNEIRTGPDLDNAQIILHDAPESVQVLERFLGTHGWRRFVRSNEPALEIHTSDPRRQPQVFSQENRPLAVMQKEFEERLALLLPPLSKTGFHERDDLEEQRDQAAEAVALAVGRLRLFEEQSQFWLRFPLVLSMVLLFVLSLILMLVGLYRIVRAHKVATPAFGGAFACLAVLLGMMMLGSWIGPIQLTTISPMASHGQPGWDVQIKLAEKFALAPSVRPVPGQPLTGAFHLRAGKLAELENQVKLDRGVAKDAPEMVGRSRRELGENYAFTGRKQENQNVANLSPAMKKAFDRARRIGEKAATAAVEIAPNPPKIKPAAANLDKKQAAEAQREAAEYFHQHVPNMNLPSDTLLWYPTLWLANGAADVHFDIASGNATYRVLLLGHSSTGRLGFYETRLDVLGR